MLTHNEPMDRQIDVAGAEDQSSPPRRPVRSDRRIRPVVAGGLGLLVGSVATLALSQPSTLDVTAPDTTQTISEPDEIAPVRTTATPVEQPSLAELIPGLTSDLVAFGIDSSGFPVVQRWNLDARAPSPTVARVQSGSADLSMTYLASLEDQRYGEGFDLVVGTPNFVETVAIDAGTFAWSTTTPREIAWTERTETGLVIKSRHVPQRPEGSVPFEIPVPGDVFIAWFQQDTVTVQDNQGMLTTYDRDGAMVASLEFNGGSDVLTPAIDIAGVAIVEDVPYVVSTNLDLLASIPVATPPCLASGFAPGADLMARRLAMQCFGGGRGPVIEVFDIVLEGDDVTMSAPTMLPMDQPAVPMWLGSDRFIGFTVPSPAGRPRTDFEIFDLLTGDHHTLSWPGSVFRVIAFGPR